MNDLSKKYYKIKEVSEIIGVPQTTLRFWEKEFDEIQPRRSEHNQRYFTPEDIETIRIIKFLIKDKGMKIGSVKEYLKHNKKNISRRLEIVDKLTRVREDLRGMLHSLNLRAKVFGIESEDK